MGDCKFNKTRLFVLLALFGGCASSSRHNQAEGRVMTMELAQVLVSHKSYDAAVPLLQRAAQSNPDDPEVHRLLGVVLRERGLYDESLRALRLSLKLEPEHPDTLSAMGMLLDVQGASKEAEAWHRGAIERQPQRADFHNNLGFCLYLQKRDQEAIASYGEALRRDPTLRRTYNNMGFAQARSGDYDAALRSFRQAGSKASAYASLGFAYEVAGDLSTARDLYTEAIKLDHKLAVAKHNLDNLDRKQAAQSVPPTKDET